MSWTFIGKKKHKKWLIYAYSCEDKEIIAWVWGKRNKKTALKLRQKLKDLGVRFGSVCTDNWEVFCIAFQSDKHKIGKAYTAGIEGNNTRLRARIRRAGEKLLAFQRNLKIT